MKVCHALLAFTFACVSLPGDIQALTFEVKEENSTCIKAELSVSFSITYNTSSSTRTVQLPLPDSSTVDIGRSTCGSDSSPARLAVLFGPGHALGLSFTTNLSVYSVANLTLQYNLSDAVSFPDANSPVVVFEFTTSVGMWASTNTTYRCVSPTAVRVGGDTVTFSDVRLEAYMPGNDLSPTVEECQMDQDHMLIPIIVGAALAGLVLIVLIAYLMGRKRTHAGYQTI
ncbi:lysosome-associated membrane glycoprotein 1a [Solea solea]|uniref:lysosome-associated membrane glycoprotein 1a n=1 Tax=Solea solea TaxID=90069 RepID=UPI00272D94CC|nr:lysosome-associated membrane glycoprotein 1a [Solea solea]